VTRNPWRFGRAMRPISGRARRCPAGTIFRKKRRMKPTASFANSLSRTAGKPPERIYRLADDQTATPLVHSSLYSGPARDPRRRPHRPLISTRRRRAQTARRRLHCAHQDDDRAGHLLHGRAGIGSMRDLKKVGRVGVKTLFYFEAVSTLALVMGLVVGKLLRPGKGFDIDPTTLDASAVASYVNRAKEEGFVSHLLGIIPETFIGAFTGGDLLQVLLVSILTGFAISRLGELGERINAVIDGMAKVFFGVIQIIVRAAPIGAFGAWPSP